MDYKYIPACVFTYHDPHMTVICKKGKIAYDTIIANDENKEKFKVILNTLTNLYEASKPEIFEKDWHNEKFPPLVYLHGLFDHTIDDEKVNRARIKMGMHCPCFSMPVFSYSLLYHIFLFYAISYKVKKRDNTTYSNIITLVWWR